MFEYFHNTLCVEAKWLYDDANIISQSNYKNLLKRGWLKALRIGGNGRTALVAFDSIPDRFKTEIIEKYGDPRDSVKNDRFKDYLITDLKAVNFYNDHTLYDGSALPDKNKDEYLANAIILNAIRTLLNETKSKRGKISTLWKNVAEAAYKLPKHSYPHSLPRNVQSLKRVYAKYIATETTKKMPRIGYESLIHGGFCNDNSEKINEDAKVWTISRWADRVAKCANMAQLLFEYNEMAKQKGWKELKEEKTLHKYLHKEGVKHLWWGHRYGDAAAKEKFAYQHSTKLPTMRDSLWYSDGTKLNYFYQDEEGNVKTLQVYEVMDAYSEVLLGYHISTSENYVAQYHAFKMAVQTSGHRPYEVRFDGQGGHKKLKAGNFLDKIAHLAIKTAPYNGKSKTIESAFKRIQTHFQKRDWFFTGQNITAKKLESKVNREFQLANKKKLPFLNEMIETYKKRREEWNNAPHPQTRIPRIEMYRQSTNPNAPEIGIWDMVNAFWIVREKPVMCHASGINFTEQKVKYQYVVYAEDGLPDVEWIRNNVDKKFHIKFDPEDMSMIYLYEKDALGLRFVTEARTKVVTARNIQEQEGWETEYYAAMKKKNNESRIATDDKMETMLENEGRSAEQYGLKSPSLLGLKGASQKVANNIGMLQKRESNMVALSDEEMDEVFVETVQEVEVEESDEINIYKMISRTQKN